MNQRLRPTFRVHLVVPFSGAQFTRGVEEPSPGLRIYTGATHKECRAIARATLRKGCEYRLDAEIV